MALLRDLNWAFVCRLVHATQYCTAVVNCNTNSFTNRLDFVGVEGHADFAAVVDLVSGVQSTVGKLQVA